MNAAHRFWCAVFLIKREESFHMRKKILMWILGVFVGLFVLYFCGVCVFYGRFLPNTFVNNHSITMRTPEEVTLDLVTQTKRRYIELVDKQGKIHTITFQQLGVRDASDLYFVNKQVSSSWLWVKSLWQPMVYTVDEQLFYEKEDIANCVENLDMVTGGSYRRVSDMRVILTEDGYDVVSSQDGYYVNQEQLTKVICQAIDRKQFRIDLEKANCYAFSDVVVENVPVKAEIQDEDKLEAVQISLQLEEGLLEQVPTSVLELAVYGSKTGEVFLNPAVISSYINTFSQSYDTYEKSRQFVTSLGNTLELQPSVTDTYQGYQVDRMSLLCSVVEQLSRGENGVIQVPWLSVGRELQNRQSDIGNTYLEISIENQHLWFYQDGKLVIDTDVVTGLDKKQHWQTPRGMFEVSQLHQNYTMYYEDGSATCEYFIQITPNGVGIHDSKRSEYGSTIYQNNGSHGCINIPFDVEKVIFECLSEMKDYHIPVIIY